MKSGARPGWRVHAARTFGVAVLATLTIFCGLAHAQGADDPGLARLSFVVDGDSIWVTPQGDGQRLRLRLQGIDAPEICQSGGLAARAALQRLLRGEALHVAVHAHDRFGRAIASVRRQRDGLDVAARMVHDGWAWSEAPGGRPGVYSREQATAQAARYGVFAEPLPRHPADFRRLHGPCDWQASVRSGRR